MVEVVDLFKAMILVQLFFSVGINMYVYALPDDALTHVTSFQDLSDEVDLDNVGSEFEDSIQAQTELPLVEVGALIFYSGNILLDLLTNFMFAIPQMIGLILAGFLFLVGNIDIVLVGWVEAFISAAVIVIYILGLIQLITGLRSGRLV